MLRAGRYTFDERAARAFRMAWPSRSAARGVAGGAGGRGRRTARTSLSVLAGRDTRTGRGTRTRLLLNQRSSSRPTPEPEFEWAGFAVTTTDHLPHLSVMFPVHLTRTGIKEEAVEGLPAIGHLAGTTAARDGAETGRVHSGPGRRLFRALGQQDLGPDLEATGRQATVLALRVYTVLPLTRMVPYLAVLVVATTLLVAAPAVSAAKTAAERPPAANTAPAIRRIGTLRDPLVLDRLLRPFHITHLLDSSYHHGMRPARLFPTTIPRVTPCSTLRSRTWASLFRGVGSQYGPGSGRDCSGGAVPAQRARGCRPLRRRPRRPAKGRRRGGRGIQSSISSVELARSRLRQDWSEACTVAAKWPIPNSPQFLRVAAVTLAAGNCLPLCYRRHRRAVSSHMVSTSLSRRRTSKYGTILVSGKTLYIIKSASKFPVPASA